MFFLLLNSAVKFQSYIKLFVLFFVYCSLHFLFSVLFESFFPNYLFWSIFFTYFHISFNSLSNTFPSNLISSPSNCTVLPLACIANIISSLIELHSFLAYVSKFPWSTDYLTQTYNTLHVTFFLPKLLSYLSPLPPSFFFTYNHSSLCLSFEHVVLS